MMKNVNSSAMARASDSRLREPQVESCKTMGKFFTIYCSSSLSYISDTYTVVDKCIRIFFAFH